MQDSPARDASSLRRDTACLAAFEACDEIKREQIFECARALELAAAEIVARPLV